MVFDERAWLIHGDNRDVYPRLGRVNAVITDPPYGEHVHHHNRSARNASREVVFSPIPFSSLTTRDVEETAAFIREKCEGWSVLFSEQEGYMEWRKAVGFEKLGWPMVWVKPDARPNFRGDGPGVGHEMMQACWVGRGKRRWNGGGKVGVFHHNKPRAEAGGFRHPTEKPVSLMLELVRLFTNPGDVVFDPFMGCGSTGVAALRLGRRFIGVERDERYYREAANRVRQELAQVPLLSQFGKEVRPTLLGDSEFVSTNTRKRLNREAKEKETTRA